MSQPQQPDGQSSPYGQPPFSQSPFSQPQYEQPRYGQPQFDQPTPAQSPHAAPYGQPPGGYGQVPPPPPWAQQSAASQQPVTTSAFGTVTPYGLNHQIDKRAEGNVDLRRGALYTGLGLALGILVYVVSGGTRISGFVLVAVGLFFLVRGAIRRLS